MTKSYDREMEELELDRRLKEALAKGDHKQADALIEAHTANSDTPAGEIL